jgi:hypothetical protein
MDLTLARNLTNSPPRLNHRDVLQYFVQWFARGIRDVSSRCLFSRLPKQSLLPRLLAGNSCSFRGHSLRKCMIALVSFYLTNKRDALRRVLERIHMRQNHLSRILIQIVNFFTSPQYCKSKAKSQWKHPFLWAFFGIDNSYIKCILKI